MTLSQAFVNSETATAAGAGHYSEAHAQVYLSRRLAQCGVWLVKIKRCPFRVIETSGSTAKEAAVTELVSTPSSIQGNSRSPRITVGLSF